MQWEYFADNYALRNSMNTLEVALNKMGEKGWELVSTTQVGEYFLVIFKRPKLTEPPKIPLV